MTTLIAPLVRSAATRNASADIVEREAVGDDGGGDLRVGGQDLGGLGELVPPRPRS